MSLSFFFSIQWRSGRWSSPWGRAPRERAQERIVEHVVLPHREEVAEVMQFAPLERGPDPVAKQMTDIPMPPDMVEIVTVVQEVARLVSQEEVQWIDERMVEVPLPQTVEENVDVVGSFPGTRAADRGSNCGGSPGARPRTSRGAESGYPSFPMMEKIVEIVTVTPHERDQENCTVQVMDFQVPLVRGNREGVLGFCLWSAHGCVADVSCLSL